MAGGEVYVSFGGDTAGLEASLASANASVRAFARELSQLSSEQVKAGASADSAIGQKMLLVARELDEAKKSSAEFKAELKETGEAAEGGIFARMTEGLSGALAPLTAIKANLGEMVELVAAAFAVEKIADWIGETTEAAEKFERIAASMGVSTAQVQQLSGMARLTGTDFGEMQTQLERLQLTLAKAAESATPAAAALKALGVDAAEFRNLSPAAQVGELAEAFSRFGDGAGKTAAATALLGKAGADLIPFLDRGKEGMDELNAAIERSGAVMSGGMIEGFSKTREGISELSLAMTALSQQIYGAFDQAARGGVLILTDLVEALTKSIAEGGAFGLILDGLAVGLKVVESALVLSIQTIGDMVAIAEGAVLAVKDYFLGLGKTIGEIFVDLAKGIPAFFAGLVNAATQAAEIIIGEFKTLGAVIGDVLELNFSGAKAASADFGATVTAGLASIKAGFAGAFDFSDVAASSRAANAAVAADFDTMFQEILTRAKTAKSEFSTLWGSHTEGPAAPAKPQVPMLDLAKPKGGGSGDGAARAAQQGAQREVDAAKAAAGQIEQLEDGKLARHEISMATWLQDTLKALSAEAVAVQAAYDKELATAGLTSEQIKEIKNKEQKDLEEIAKRETAAENKAADDTAKKWEEAAKTIESALDGQVKGLLEGTESWNKAFKNVLEDMTVKLIEATANWGVDQAAYYAKNILGFNAQVAQHTAGNATMAASDASSSAAGLTGILANVAKSIQAFAGEVGAGVAAFLAPVLGPGAVPAGAAAAAATVSLGGLYDAGSWSVPHDMVAGLHAGEVVIPQRGGLADQFRDLAAGGGIGGGGGGRAVHVHPTTNFNISAHDSASVARWARENGADIARGIEQAVRHGTRLGFRGA